MSSGLRLQRCESCSSCSSQQAAPPVAAPKQSSKQSTAPPAACQPTPESYAVVRDEGQMEGTLGLTKLDPASSLICAPDQIVPGTGASAGTCTFTARPLSLAFISKYVRPGDHPTGLSRQVPGCQGDVPIVFRISDEISGLAKQGEQEHCADLKTAFDRTLKPCGEAMNRLVGTPLAGQGVDPCFADLVQKLGFDPINCTREFLRLQKATDQRDERDWHTFDPVLISSSCEQVVFGMAKASQNKIGDQSVASDVLVPQATGCSATASPAPTSPAPSPPPPSPAQPGRTRLSFGPEISQEQNDDDDTRR